MYRGDIIAGATLEFKFNTCEADGTPITLAGTPSLCVYKGSSATQSTAGVTLAVDFDSITGMHRVSIDTSADGSFYSAGSDFSVQIAAGTVDSISQIGVEVGSFSIENRNDKADVREYGGSAGTFSGGRPEVNATHWAGTAVASAVLLNAANIGADAITNAKIADDAFAVEQFADNFLTAAKIASNAIAAAKIASDAITAIQSGLATSSEVTSIQNNTKCVRVVPDLIERPDSGTTTYRVELLLYDSVGNMEAPDSAPTIALVNQSGTDRSSRLDSTTMALVSTGRYRAIYTADSADTIEQLVWAFSVVEGGNTRVYGNNSLIVDTTAVDFTSSDRADIQTLLGRITAAVVLQSQLPSNFSSLGINGSGHISRVTLADTLTTYTGNTVQTGDAFARLGAPAGASVSADIAAAKADTAAIKTKTDALPGSPAAVGSLMGITDGAITSAKFSVSAIAGVATGILEKMDQLWRRFFKKSIRDKSGLTIKTYADNGTDVLTTQAYTSTSTTDTVGTSS